MATKTAAANTITEAQVKLTSQQNGARDLGLDPADWTLGQVTKTTTYSGPTSYES